MSYTTAREMSRTESIIAAGQLLADLRRLEELRRQLGFRNEIILLDQLIRLTEVVESLCRRDRP